MKYFSIFVFISTAFASSPDLTLSSNVKFKHFFPCGNISSIGVDYFRGNHRILTHVKSCTKDNLKYNYHLYGFGSTVKSHVLMHYVILNNKVQSLYFDPRHHIFVDYTDYTKDGIFDLITYRNEKHKYIEIFQKGEGHNLKPVSEIFLKQFYGKSGGEVREFDLINNPLKTTLLNEMLKNKEINKEEYDSLKQIPKKLLTK
jgi:hypothetical protein